MELKLISAHHSLQNRRVRMIRFVLFFSGKNPRPSKAVLTSRTSMTITRSLNPVNSLPLSLSAKMISIAYFTEINAKTLFPNLLIHLDISQSLS